MNRTHKIELDTKRGIDPSPRNRRSVNIPVKCGLVERSGQVRSLIKDLKAEGKIDKTGTSRDALGYPAS